MSIYDKFLYEMNLKCLNGIITDNLAIHIDISNVKSWNLNSNLTLISLTKWNGAISDNLNLLDFGLTGIDNGRVNNMLSGLTLTSNDTKLKLYRIGYYSSGHTIYSGYTITSFTGTSVGNYFYLNGGYLQGFFKLDKYNFEIFPPRYNKGITIETLFEILPTSQGIFFMMGTRAEDKYNPYYSGETRITGQTTYLDSLRIEHRKYRFSGITTSEGNYLESYGDKEINKIAFPEPEHKSVVVNEAFLQLGNIKNNIIAFMITDDKRLAYKYIDNDGLIAYNESPNTITKIGWTIIDIIFTPYNEIDKYDPALYQCYPRRLGTLCFYINGRLFWKITDFLEWYSRPLENNKEIQLGVPFNVSFGGGSFGLEHSWHFSGNTTNPYVQDTRKNNLTIEKNFNNSYVGNIQKLRMYNIALTSNEVLYNTMYEIRNNLNYNILVNKGGRLINGLLSDMNITQQTAGSDIRKSVKYRNSDGTYKNLLDMIDVKVVVKSKSNTSVELVKFKKVAESGWLALIPIDDYTYDFIVPDTITSAHPNEVLYVEIKFQWTDPYDIDNILDKIFIANLITSALLDNTIKNY
jgi:hypothetical protein